MPITKCINCGHITNSATSNYWLDTEMDGKTPKETGVATKCYVSLVDDKWVEGCVYNDIGPIQRKLFDRLLEKRDT